MAKNTSDIRWFTREGSGTDTDAPHSFVKANIDSIRSRCAFRAEADRFNMRLYSDLRYVGLGTGRASYDTADMVDGRLSENVIKSIIETLHSKITKPKPKPTFVTEGGNWQRQQDAKNQDKYCQGRFHEIKAYQLARMAELVCLITGTGFIKVYNDGEKVCAEHAPSWEIDVDPSEARYGTPRTIYQTKRVDKLVLKECYPEFADEIEEQEVARAVNDVFDLDVLDSTAEMVRVVEAWRLPSKPGAEDGRHVICIDGCTLVNEPWKRERFPFAITRWSRRPIGFWGCGVPEELIGAQLELNRSLTARQEAIRLLGAPYVLVEKGSKVVKSHLSNLIGRIIEYTGTPPQVVAPSAVSPELFQHASTVKAAMFENSGVSQMSAGSMKPAGLNSGKALRTYSDLESERFIDGAREYEDLILQLAELILDESEALAEEKGSLEVTFVGDKSIEKIKWSQLDRNSYVLKITPTSSLSTTFAGKMEDLKDLKDLQIVTDPLEMRAMLSMPDLQSNEDRQLAGRNLLRRIVEVEILEKGNVWMPEPFWPLDMALQISTNALLEAQLNDCPEEKLQILRDFIENIQAKIQEMTPPPAPPMASPGAAPLPPGDPGALAAAPLTPTIV